MSYMIHDRSLLQRDSMAIGNRAAPRKMSPPSLSTEPAAVRAHFFTTSSREACHRYGG